MSKDVRANAVYALGACAQLMPEQRLCQIIVNATGASDPFYVTDDSLAVMLVRYFETVEAEKSKAPREGGGS